MSRPQFERLEPRRLLTGAPYLLADVNPDGRSFASQFAELDGQLYFYADDGVHGYELWRTDGISGGTELFLDIYPGVRGSRLLTRGSEGAPVFVEMNGKLYFSATDDVHGAELWVTDGTLEGTSVLDIQEGTPSSRASPKLILSDDVMLLQANDPDHGQELWVTDGSLEGTRLLSDIRPGAVGSQTKEFVEAGGVAYFVADDGVHGKELWRSNGAPEGTELVADLAAGRVSSNPYSLTPAGDDLVFLSELDRDLRIVEPGAAEPRILTNDLLTDAAWQHRAPPSTIGASDDAAYFWTYWEFIFPFAYIVHVKVDTAISDAPITSLAIQLDLHFASGLAPEYQASVTESGEIADIWDADATLIGKFGDFYYYTQSTAGHGMELQRTERGELGIGTVGNEPSQTDSDDLFADFNPGPGSSNPVFLGATADALFFAADDGVHGREVWVIPLGPPCPPGDVNLDGVTDLLDFNVLKENFGVTDASRRDGDLNEDDVIDLYDFNLLKADFGNGAAAAVSPTPVASPDSDADLLVGTAIDAAFSGEDEEG